MFIHIHTHEKMKKMKKRRGKLVTQCDKFIIFSTSYIMCVCVCICLLLLAFLFIFWSHFSTNKRESKYMKCVSFVIFVYKYNLHIINRQCLIWYKFDKNCLVCEYNFLKKKPREANTQNSNDIYQHIISFFFEKPLWKPWDTKYFKMWIK